MRTILTCILIAAFASAGHAQTSVVLLLHPTLKDWAPTMTTRLTQQAFQPIQVAANTDGQAPPKVSVVVGAAIKTIKEDWNYAFQIGPASPRPGMQFGNTVSSGGFDVPYVLYYRSSAKAKPAEIAKSTMIANPEKIPGGSFATRFIGSDVSSDLQVALVPKVAVKTQAMGEFRVSNMPSRPNYAIPVERANGQDGPVATIDLNNRWPFPVFVRITALREKVYSQPGDRYLDLTARDQRGDLGAGIWLELAAGEKRTVTMPVADLKGVDARWTNAQVRIVDSTVAPK